MYRKNSSGWIKHVDFILLDLLCVQFAFYLSFVLRLDAWNPYVIPLYRNMAVFVELANPGDLFIQKADASTIGDLAKAVQQLFGDTGTNIIGTRHGEKLYETLMTKEERLRAEDMGGYYRVAADSRDLNYDKFVVNGEVHTMADESYTSHNTIRLDIEGTVRKILTTDYVKEELEGIRHN